jgi:hypothetical protein
VVPPTAIVDPPIVAVLPGYVIVAVVVEAGIVAVSPAEVTVLAGWVTTVVTVDAEMVVTDPRLFALPQ